MPPCLTRAAALALGLLLPLATATPASAERLCVAVTMNDRPAGNETRLRLSAAGQPSVTGRPAAGALTLDGLAPGAWTVIVQHPRTKSYRTTVPLSGPTTLRLDCGYADNWSGCQPEVLSGC